MRERTDGVNHGTKARAAHRNAGYEGFALFEVEHADGGAGEEDKAQAAAHDEALDEEELKSHRVSRWDREEVRCELTGANFDGSKKLSTNKPIPKTKLPRYVAT